MLLKTLFNFVKPPPPPPPLPESKPVEPDFADAKRAEQNQLGRQWRDKLEQHEKTCAPFVENAGQVSDAGNPSPKRIRRIAEQNAPLLVLPPGNLPADPQEYIAHSRLRENVPVQFESPDLSFWNGSFDPTPIRARDAAVGDNTNGDANDDFTAADVGNNNQENAFLDLDNEMRGRFGKENAPVFYQFQAAEYGANRELKESPSLTYHVFHAFNDGPTPLTSATPVADHEGDWERVTYKLNPQRMEPETAILSAHEDEHARIVSFDSLKNNLPGRPLVYVADGSHANYETPGNYPLPATAADRTATDANGDDIVNEADGAVIFDSAGNLSEVTAQSWYPSGTNRGVKWGEISALQNFDLGQANALLPSGSQGHSTVKGAVEP